jgi:hypothetical protein
MSSKWHGPDFVLSRYMSLTAMFAAALARNRGHSTIDVSDFLASCYITEPIRFLSYWSDTLKCIEAISLDCELLDPVWTYQLKLTQQIESEVLRDHGSGYPYADDLRRILSEASKPQKNTRSTVGEIDLPSFLLTVRGDPRFSRLFTSGFRLDLAASQCRSKLRTR